jgi:hypothetical protein
MNDIVNVNALRLRKHKAENDIDNIIERFKQDTGLLVTDVHITHLDTSSMIADDVRSYVTLKVDLEL